jgi:hypothetical protein
VRQAVVDDALLTALLECLLAPPGCPFFFLAFFRDRRGVNRIALRH